MTARPVTYNDIWQQYAEGKVSTCVMRRLLRDDEVFRQWCIRRAEQERRARDKQAGHRLVEAAKEALEIARGGIEPVRLHMPDDDMA